MLQPSSYGVALVLIAVASLLWGFSLLSSRLDRKWRFELFSFDFAFGTVLASILLAITAGNVSTPDTFAFDDILTVASKRNMVTAAAAGAIYCLGNLLVLAGASVAGISSALPAAASLWLLVAVAFAALRGNVSSTPLAAAAVALALAALLLTALAQKHAALANPVKRGLHPGWKGFILASVSGLFLAASLPLADLARPGDIGLGPFGVTVFFSVGILALSPLCNLYFLNLPVHGDALSPLAWFKGSFKQHLSGLLGGALFSLAILLVFSVAAAVFPSAPSLLASQSGLAAGALPASAVAFALLAEHANSPKVRSSLTIALLALAAAAALAWLAS
jgi:glucose uptake protein